MATRSTSDRPPVPDPDGPDWTAIDQALSPEFHTMRDRLAKLFGFQPDEWLHLPMLRQLGRNVAIVELAGGSEKALHSWEGAPRRGPGAARGGGPRRQLRRWRAAADKVSLPHTSDRP